MHNTLYFLRNNLSSLQSTTNKTKDWNGPVFNKKVVGGPDDKRLALTLAAAVCVCMYHTPVRTPTESQSSNACITGSRHVALSVQ